MLLSVAERILLLNVIPPAEGDFLFLKAVRTLRESLGFSEAEAAEVALSRTATTVKWDETKAPMKEIEIGPMVAAYVSKSIKASPHLKEEYLDVYSRFLVEEE